MEVDNDPVRGFDIGSSAKLSFRNAGVDPRQVAKVAPPVCLEFGAQRPRFSGPPRSENQVAADQRSPQQLERRVGNADPLRTERETPERLTHDQWFSTNEDFRRERRQSRVEGDCAAGYEHRIFQIQIEVVEREFAIRLAVRSDHERRESTRLRRHENPHSSFADSDPPEPQRFVRLAPRGICRRPGEDARNVDGIVPVVSGNLQVETPERRRSDRCTPQERGQNGIPNDHRVGTHEGPAVLGFQSNARDGGSGEKRPTSDSLDRQLAGQLSPYSPQGRAERQFLAHSGLSREHDGQNRHEEHEGDPAAEASAEQGKPRKPGDDDRFGVEGGVVRIVLDHRPGIRHGSRTLFIPVGPIRRRAAHQNACPIET